MTGVKCNNEATALCRESNSCLFHIAMTEYPHAGKQKTKLKLGSMI
jgi:hypothetical protein